MRKNLIAGFTLIELLVVVAILGVLSSCRHYVPTMVMSQVQKCLRLKHNATNFISSDRIFYTQIHIGLMALQCTSPETTTKKISNERNLLDVPIAYKDISFYFCISRRWNRLYNQSTF